MKKLLFPIVILLVSFALAACGAASPTEITSTSTPGPQVFVAEGHIIPQTSLNLSFLVRGKVEEILVSKGDKVTAGQVLIRLADQEQAQASLAAAKLEQISATQALDDLNRTSSLAHAQDWQTYINAQQARAAAERAWEKLDLDAVKEEISNAQADVNSAKADLEDAQKEFDKYKDLDQDNTTRKNAEDALKIAQDAYNETLRKLEGATNKRDSLQAAMELSRAAEAEAKRSYENTLSGADQDNLNLLEQRVASANAQVSAAQFLLDSYELRAPIDGTIADINLIVGQQAGPETWAVVLADFSQWFVDTNDLSELDVVKVKTGQQVEISADALPGQIMTGVVEEIAIAPKIQAGDILYTVHIKLNDPDVLLRWGMTVEVTFPEN